MRSPVISERGRAVGNACEFRRLLQVLVVEGERLVVVVDLRQVGIGEDVGQDAPLAADLRLDLAVAPCASSRPSTAFWFSQSFG